MLGARDLAFPRVNITSWYFFIAGGTLALAGLAIGGVDTGWTFYTPLSTRYAQGYVVLVCFGIILSGYSSDYHGLNFIVTIHKLRPPGMGSLTLAPLPVVALLDIGDLRSRDAGIYDANDPPCV